MQSFAQCMNFRPELVSKLRSNSQLRNFMNCAYQRGCPNEAAEGFNLCDICRILDMSDALRICVDPTSPTPTAHLKEVVEQRIITRMTGDETLRFITNIENVYLELCKVRLLLKPKVTDRRVKLSLEEEITTGRSAIPTAKEKVAKKAAKKKDSILDKQMNLLGCSQVCRDSHNAYGCPHYLQAKKIYEDPELSF